MSSGAAASAPYAPLRRLLLISGTALVLQGVLNLVLGPWLHLAADGTAAGDSDARFLGGLLTGVGAAWISLSRRPELPLLTIRLLAGGMLLGAVGRVVSLALDGPTSVLASIVLAVEIVVPTVVVLLSRPQPATPPTPVPHT